MIIIDGPSGEVCVHSCWNGAVCYCSSGSCEIFMFAYFIYICCLFCLKAIWGSCPRRKPISYLCSLLTLFVSFGLCILFVWEMELKLFVESLTIPIVSSVRLCLPTIFPGVVACDVCTCECRGAGGDSAAGVEFFVLWGLLGLVV